MTEINTPSDAAVPSPTRPKHWLQTTLLYSLIFLVLFWTIRPTARPFIAWLNPTAEQFLRADGDKQALVVGGFTNGAALYGVKVRVNRDGQPVQRYVLSKVEPGFLYPVTTPPDASGQIGQVYLQSGDTITLEANTYLLPLVYRFEQLQGSRVPAKTVTPRFLKKRPSLSEAFGGGSVGRFSDWACRPRVRTILCFHGWGSPEEGSPPPSSPPAVCARTANSR